MCVWVGISLCFKVSSLFLKGWGKRRRRSSCSLQPSCGRVQPIPVHVSSQECQCCSEVARDSDIHDKGGRDSDIHDKGGRGRPTVCMLGNTLVCMLPWQTGDIWKVRTYALVN